MAAAAATALALAGCSGTSGSGGGTPTTVLSVATTASVTTWNPVTSFSTEVFYLANVYETLLRVNPAGSKERFSPVLATSWTASADKKTWTFVLRQGVTFHDGEKLTSRAVKQSVEAAAKKGGASFIWAPLKQVRTPDDSTVVFDLKYAAPIDLIASSMYGAWIVSPKALDAVAAKDTYFESGIDAGTGPYTLSKVESGKQVVLAKYPAYWGGWQGRHYETVINRITPEAATQQQLLEGGEVQLATSLPLENVTKIADGSRFQVSECRTASNYLGFFNTARKPLDDVRVRQALAAAIPYEDILKVGGQGFGSLARSAVPAGIYPYSESTPATTQDLGKARALLAQAGVKNLRLELTYAAENQAQKRFAPLIKDAFTKIGVDVTVTPVLFNQQWERAKADPAKAQDIFLLLYWPTYSDAGSDNLYSLFHSSAKPFFNLSYWKDAQYDGLVDKAGTLTATDEAKAKDLYGQAMTRLHDQAPGFFLYDVRSPIVTPKGLGGAVCNENYAFNLFFHQLTPPGA